MSPAEKSLLTVEREIAEKSARRIERYLTRPDLSPACRKVALEQLDEYRAEARRCEQQIAGGRWPFGVFEDDAALDRLAQASADLAEVRAELRQDSERAQRRMEVRGIPAWGRVVRYVHRQEA